MTENNTVHSVNVETGEVTEMELDPIQKALQAEGYAAQLEYEKKLKAEQDALKPEAIAKAEADRAALLARLGITAEEAALLLGGTN